MNLNKVRDSFTQIIAMQLHANNRKNDGVMPHASLTEGWEQAYNGTPANELPPYSVEMNYFKHAVDCCVAMLMCEITKQLKDS